MHQADLGSGPAAVLHLLLSFLAQSLIFRNLVVIVKTDCSSRAEPFLDACDCRCSRNARFSTKTILTPR
jgi:hypothetical protein